MQTVALVNMKGGVGKTTLAVNLAWSLCRHAKKRVLLVDLDPQFNASQYLLTYERYDAQRKKHGTVANVLLDTSRSRMPLTSKPTDDEFSILAPIDRVGKGAYLFLLPSELELARAVKNPQGVEFRLHKLLQRWERYFDYAFIDCAPTDTVLTATAFMAANFVLVPMRPDRFSILGYGLMKEVIDNFRRDYPDPSNVQDLGVVFTRVSKTPHPIELECKTSVKKIASYVFKTEIHESTSYLRSVHQQSPVFETPYARELTKASINSLVAEMNQRIASLSASSTITS